MDENRKEQEIIDLRIQFAEETGKYAIIHKEEYVYWLERNLVKKLALCSVSKSLPSSEYIWVQARSESDRRIFIDWFKQYR